MGWYDYKPYVPVAKRRAEAAREVAKRLKNGEAISPIRIEGRTIAKTFWGQAWCTNLESYGDLANRLPRGRTYVRNGSVVDLKMEKGRIRAMVSGSELYEIVIDIAPVSKPDWQALKQRCAGQIGSLIELLQGKLSKDVMAQVTNRSNGLFPKPAEIKMKCSCPDYAGMCKHLAAVMYGVGNRLDSSPELLFLLRGVDHTELIEQAIPAAPSRTNRGARTIAAENLGDVFGIEMDEPIAEPATVTRIQPGTKSAPKKTTTPKKAAANQAKTVAPASPKPAKKPAAKKAPAVKPVKVNAKIREQPAKKAVVTKAPASKPTKQAPARKKG
jgi:uncharacterized Zn finger protein